MFARNCIALIGMLLACRCAYAQVASSQLGGRVTDASGAIVVGTRLTLVNVETGVQRTAETNTEGYYAFTSLQPGSYQLTAEKEGFVKASSAAMGLSVDQRARLDIQLKLGAVAEVLNVSADAAQLQVSSSELGAVMPEKQVVDLPLNGRNFTQLLTLTPGASPVSVGQNRGGGQVTAVGDVTYPSINGQSNRSNMFLTDGVNNLGTFMGTYGVPPIVDTVQEFKVQSHNDQAEVGMVTGGSVNVVTKSGTNEVHGTAWEFLRNDALDARNTFRQQRNTLRQNMFGGTIGGPVIRNRTFFYAGYQGYRYRAPSNSLYRVPTGANLQGDFSDWPRQIFDPATTRVENGRVVRNPFPGNQIPVSRLDPGFLEYAKLTLPPPIATGVADRNQLDLTPRQDNQEEYNARVDHTFSQKDMVWGRISGQVYDRTSSGGRQTLRSYERYNNYNIGASWVHTFTPTDLMNVQFGRLLLKRDSGSSFTADGVATAAGFNAEFCCAFLSGAQLAPNVNVVQFFSGGEAINNSTPSDLWQYKANYTKIAGAHEMKIGAEFNDVSYFTAINDHTVRFDQTGTADPQNQGNTGSPLASMLLNVPVSAERRDFNKTTRFGGVIGFFAQDSWKITSRLTMNIGLRYDRTFLPPIGKQSNKTIYMGNMDLLRGIYFVQAVPNSCLQLGRAPCVPTADGALPANVQLAPDGVLVKDWTDNWQPRFGLAYRATDKLALRGSVGLFYDSWAGATQLTQNLGHTWPDVGRRQAQGLNLPTVARPLPSISGKDPFPSALTPSPTPFADSAFFVDPNFKNAKSVQWNVGIQQQLPASTVVGVNYVGSATTRLPLGGLYNVALNPGPGDPASRRPFPYIIPMNFDKSWGRSNYHSLQLQMQRRYSNGFSLVANYTWAKAMSVGCDGFFGVEGCSVQNPYNFNSEKSVSGTDLTHIFNAGIVYELPFGRGRALATGLRAVDGILGGWQVNSILQFYSGQPYTVNVTGDIANTGNGTAYMRPNLVGGPQLSDPTPQRWINTAAFASPARYTFGNAGRNILRGDGANNIDLSLFREFRLPLLRESSRLQFRAEAFNAFNTPRYAAPVSNFSNPSFGHVLATANNARQLQLGLKILF